jgi:hypothetical protein
VHDTVDLEARGVPAVFVATTEFVDGARAQAQALGADPAGVFVAHPIQDRSDAELVALAGEALPRIVAALEAAGGAPASGASQ